jgi:hypothetical protein
LHSGKIRVAHRAGKFSAPRFAYISRGAVQAGIEPRVVEKLSTRLVKISVGNVLTISSSRARVPESRTKGLKKIPTGCWESNFRSNHFIL